MRIYTSVCVHQVNSAGTGRISVPAPLVGDPPPLFGVPAPNKCDPAPKLSVPVPARLNI